jgi:hypothetical protein
MQSKASTKLRFAKLKMCMLTPCSSVRMEHTSTNVADQITNTPLLEELGEEARPVRFHSDASSLDDGSDVVSLQSIFTHKTVSGVI